MSNFKPFRPKSAMIFAAGFGTRMQPLTKTTPKPLIKVKGKALLDYNIELLEKWGVENVVINTHYRASQIVEHLQSYKGSLNIKIIFEDPILETGGGVLNALEYLGSDPFLTMNSDVILIDKQNDMMSKICENWDPNLSDALMVLHNCDDAVGYDGKGDFNISEDQNIVKTANKEHAITKHDFVFTGIMLSKPEIFKDAPQGSFSIYKDFLKPKYIDEAGIHKKIKAVTNTGDWYHVGSPENIMQAQVKL